MTTGIAALAATENAGLWCEVVTWSLPATTQLWQFGSFGEVLKGIKANVDSGRKDERIQLRKTEKQRMPFFNDGLAGSSFLRHRNNRTSFNRLQFR